MGQDNRRLDVRLTSCGPTQRQMAEERIKEFLKLLGQNPNREGLKETPKRYVKFWEEFTSPPEFVFKCFDGEGSNEMVIVKDIPFYSLCEHHLAPFFGTAAIAYIPNKKIVGLSKLPRVLDMFARQPQNQERITKQVADFIMNNKDLKPKGVAVMLQARHMCVEMRGVEKPGCQTITSSLLGVFKKHEVRNEFLNLIK